jgi:long-subunit fatty acid transport protein
LIFFSGSPWQSLAGTIPISTPGGSLTVPLSYDQPPPTEKPDKVPTIQSSPLPSGSGARALGLAGAFTAVADDATAASWNPAGLTQLERPELSIVYRLSHERDRRRSSDSNYRVGEDEIDANNINYLSAVMPLRLMDRNLVVSLNYQEVFDFSQSFRAHQSDSGSKTETSTVTDSSLIDVPFDHATIYDTGPTPKWSLTPTSLKMKRNNCVQTENLTYNSEADIDFEQEGSVQAITPAFGFEVTPKLSFGGALNVYQEGLMNTPSIRSKTRANYSGTLNRVITTSSGTIDYESIAHYIYDSGFGIIEGDATDSGTKIADPLDPDVMTYRYTGQYKINEEITRFRGMNATLGSLLTVSEPLTLGFCLDLPWKARARQTKTVLSDLELIDQFGNKHVTTQTTRTSKDVEFEYPLYWALGSVWRWNNRLSTSFDVSQTWWSDYSFKEEGGTRKNPLDGSDHGEHPLDDCWSLRTGTEYLWVLKRTEIPLRGGLSWEQRPAIGKPDEYWGISLGTGISIGKGPNKVIIDIAYTYTFANSVMGSLVPDKDIGSDVQRHDVYVSCIYHF